MDLERVAAVLRPRQPWEAVDLGFAMARAWWRPVIAAWAATMVPLAALVILLTGDSPFWCFLLLWWLEPLYGLAVLHVFSRTLFGSPPGWRAATGAALRDGLRHGLWLLICRLSPGRTAALPPLILEGLTGTRRRARARLLASAHREAQWLAVAALLLELALFFGLCGLVMMLVPSSLVDWSAVAEAADGGQAPSWLMPLCAGLWLVALSIAEPCHVAGGFALYLDRRSQLEGWDVEVALRRLGRRLRRPAPGAGASAGRRAGPPQRAAVLAVLLLGTIGATAAGASTSPAHPRLPRPPAEEVIRRVLADPEFGATRTEKVWRLRDVPEVERSTGEVPSVALPVARLGATLLEALLWLVVLAGLGWLVHALAGKRRGSAPPRKGEPDLAPLGRFVPGGRGELPADVPAAALAELTAGHTAAALSLLYRGALAALAGCRHLDVAASWTEEQCLSQLGGKLPAHAGAYLRELTVAWQACAYAHRQPDTELVRELCRRWRPALLAGDGAAA